MQVPRQPRTGHAAKIQAHIVTVRRDDFVERDHRTDNEPLEIERFGVGQFARRRFVSVGCDQNVAVVVVLFKFKNFEEISMSQNG